MTTTRRTTNPRGSGERLRAEIVAAATRLLTASTAGDGVTLRAIAREAGIAAPSIYPHFADRDAILDAVVSSAFEQLRIACAAASTGTEDGAATVRAIALAYLTFATEHPGGYRMLFGRTPEDVSGRGYREGDEAFEFLVAALVRSVAEGSASSTDPVLDAQVLWAALHGLVTLVPATSGFRWRPPAELLDRVLEPLIGAPATTVTT